MDDRELEQLLKFATPGEVDRLEEIDRANYRRATLISILEAEEHRIYDQLRDRAKESQ
jgi:tRNA/tmRNA/rRNA uracil-C5-methylase (TrmA/RlmC/RlmD family)